MTDTYISFPATSSALSTLSSLLQIFVFAALIVWWRPLLRKGEANVELKKRFLDFLVLATIFMGGAYLGSFVFAVVVATAACLCLKEFFALIKQDGMQSFEKPGYALALAMVAAAYLSPLIIGSGQTVSFLSRLTQEALFYTFPFLAVFSIVLVPLAKQAYRGMIACQSLAVFALMYFAWFPTHLLLIRQSPKGFEHIVFLLAAVALNDIFAFAGGRLFGKTPLCPALSPGKTREGLISGTIGSFAAAAIFHFTMLDKCIPALLALTLTIAFTAPAGDLVISVIKRDLQVKDCGNILPGHGGFLDRFDSMIISAPAFYYLVLLLG